MNHAAALVIALALPGCATAPAAPDAAVDPRGQWTVTAVNGQATGGGEDFRFAITPPTGSAQFGCNQGGGSLSVGNGWVVTGDWIITLASCRDERTLRFERMGFDIVARPMAVEQRGAGLRLANQRGTIDLTPAPAVRSLTGSWRVTALNGQPIAAPPAFAGFDRAGMRINFGCNTMRGSYRQENGTLVPVYPLGSTEIGCMPTSGGPDPHAIEESGFAVVRRPMRITWHGERRVTLSNEAGSFELQR